MIVVIKAVKLYSLSYKFYSLKADLYSLIRDQLDFV